MKVFLILLPTPLVTRFGLKSLDAFCLNLQRFTKIFNGLFQLHILSSEQGSDPWDLCKQIAGIKKGYSLG
jgi:hypothetical protein